jgi:hypothetical protein
VTAMSFGAKARTSIGSQPEGKSRQGPEQHGPQNSLGSLVSRRAVRTSVIRPTRWQAANAHKFVGGWLAAIRAAGPAALVVDLGAAQRLDATALGILFTKCRDILKIPVTVIGAGADQVQTLRGLELLAGARVVPEPCRHPRGWHVRSDTGQQLQSWARSERRERLVQEVQSLAA